MRPRVRRDGACFARSRVVTLPRCQVCGLTQGCGLVDRGNTGVFQPLEIGRVGDHAKATHHGYRAAMGAG